MEQIDRTLYNNNVKKFILKIDFTSNDVNDFSLIVNEISKFFTRLEQRTHINYNINVNLQQNKEDVKKEQTPDYVLVDEERRLNLTFSTFQNALIIETSKYLNNVSYKDCLNIVYNAITKLGIQIQSKRIGMRYINSFQCKTMKDIAKVFSKNKSKVFTEICQREYLSRVIIQEQYNMGDYKLRSQYGIPNKFYPAIMTTYDLLLDIDSYDDSNHSFEEWDDVIKNLNHAAYDEFDQSITPKYKDSLK